MSDVMPRDILPELWEQILKRQWQYLETEESPQKLEERKKLEGSLKELLCIVRQDRKFFLPETAAVLKNSICQHKEFSVNKAITAFESISQYANNLYSKPWRKEFRILKMYSGFYQHEIKSSLIDAEKLFVGMGYRSLSDDTLILDGPICPDQVSNVFRDAITAYVELQIIKNIHIGLEANDLGVSWLDIFWYREKHVGGITQAIKDLLYAAEEKEYHNRAKVLAGDNYGYIDVQPSPNFTTPPPQCQCNSQYHPPLPRLRMTSNNGPCCLHELPHNHQSNHMFNNYPTHNYNHQQNANMDSESLSHLPHMSHSRSLEHYSEPNHGQQHTMLPHRHSFDHQQQGCTASVHHQHRVPQQRIYHSVQQQQPMHQYYRNASQNFYDPTYDCIDENSLGGGSSNISYAAVAATRIGREPVVNIGCNSGLNYNVNAPTYAEAYNVSGNRFPLPCNISNQFAAYDNNRHHMEMDPAYARVIDNHMYAQVSKMPQNYMMNSVKGAAGGGVNSFTLDKTLENCNNDHTRRQISYMPEKLIDFEDPPIIPPPPAPQFDTYQYPQNDGIRGKRFVKIPDAELNVSGNYGASTRVQAAMGKTNATSGGGDMYVYAQPIPKECRQPQKNMPSSLDKSAYLRKASINSAERGAGDTTDLSYESANDDLSALPRQHQHSPTQFTRNQDGVGSFEHWDYVFNKLGRTGYSKDSGEGEDMLVKSLGLDSLNIANDSTTPSQTSSVEKRRSGYKENDNPSQQIKHKTKIFETSAKLNVVGTTPATTANSNSKPKPQMDNNKQKIKPALKQPYATSTNTTNKPNNTSTNKKNSNMAKANDNKSKGHSYHENNNIRDLGNNKPNKKSTSGNASTQNTAARNRQSSTGTAAPTTTLPQSTQIIVTGTGEWSCAFCTLINPDTTRICEMCSHTKDFNLEAAASVSAGAATAAQSSVAHNTPTCV